MEKQQELRKKIGEIMKLGLPKQEEAKRIQELHWKKPEAKPQVAGDDLKRQAEVEVFNQAAKKKEYCPSNPEILGCMHYQVQSHLKFI